MIPLPVAMLYKYPVGALGCCGAILHAILCAHAIVPYAWRIAVFYCASTLRAMIQAMYL